jgi:hypothetical protein
MRPVQNGAFMANLIRQVLPACGLDTRHDSETRQHDSAGHDPASRYMHQRGDVRQPADHDQIPKYLKSE